jgi:hypothetical protein
LFAFDSRLVFKYFLEFLPVKRQISKWCSIPATQTFSVFFE